jgi:hypothetical protein
MEDRYGKYIRLFTTLVFTMIGLLIAFIIMLLLVRLIFGLLDYIPWSAYIYTLFIVSVPAMLFTSIYIIYFKRTRYQLSAIVKYVSYTIFSMALGFWAYFFVKDIIIFSKHAYTDIDKYNCYEMIFLAANVAAIFLVGIMQAFSAPKEKDWMEKRAERPES